MDETTKVIIQSAVTVLGMIAAFIAAFLAEPVKNHYQNKAKLQNLRIALYKELVNNYFALSHFKVQGDSDLFTPEYVARHALRTECYKHTLQNDVSLYYQLVEANAMNILYSQLDQTINLTSDLTSIYGKRSPKKSASPIFTQFSGTFRDMFVTGFYAHTYDGKTLERLVSPKQYQEIMERGKEAYKRLEED